MRGEFLKYCFIGISGVLGIICILMLFGWINNDLGVILNFDFIVWDAKHMQSLVQNGYDFPRTAFFPFFPYFWKATGLSAVAISIINGSLFLIAAAWLARFYKIGYLEFTGFIILPSMMFMFLPYAEAFMYLFSTGFILSLNSGNRLLQVLFLFLMTFTKPTAGVFLPAIIIAEFMSTTSVNDWIRRCVLLAPIILVTTGIVFFIQQLDTGEWFWFFEAQKAWGNHLQWPSLPLDTWENPQVIWLDFAAMTMSILSLLALMAMSYARFFLNRDFKKSLWYSLLYLAGSGLFVLMFRGGVLFSLNRFIFSTPFVFVAITEIRQLKLGIGKSKMAALILAITLLFSLCFGSYLHIKTLFFFLIVCALITVWLMMHLFTLKKWQSLLVIFTIALASVFYSWHLISGGWVA